MFPLLNLSSFQLGFRTGLKCYIEWKKNLDYLCNCKSEISNVCNVVEVHRLQVLKIVHHNANSLFDWLISGQQSEAISILSGKGYNYTVRFIGPILL